MGSAFDGDRIVALIGIVMAMILLGRSARLRHLAGRKRWLMLGVWAAIFVIVAVLVNLANWDGSE